MHLSMLSPTPVGGWVGPYQGIKILAPRVGHLILK